MKVDKSDLDADVVDDGETTIQSKSDVKSVVGSGHGDARMTLYDLHYPNGGCVKTSTLENGLHPLQNIKRREPTEDTEEVTGDERKENQDVNAISDALDGCHIDGNSKMLEKKMACLDLSADGKHREGKQETCTQLKTQTSVITVDPPSLNSEEEDEKNDEQEDLTCRGPMAGKPANFCQGNVGINHVAQKAYGSHNLDSFFQTSDLPVPDLHHQKFPHGFAQQINQTGYGLYGGEYGVSHYMSSFPSTTETGSSSGKRRVDDDASTPFKYTRPLPEPTGLHQNYPLNIGTNGGQQLYKQVSTGLGSGGQVVDKSANLLAAERKMKEVSLPMYLDRQFSVSDVEHFLEVLEASEPGQQQEHKSNLHAQNDPKITGHGFQQSYLDCDPGYVSENSPRYETSSPSSSPKSAYSPPPSVMSADSGVASPQNDDTMSTHMASPASDYMAHSNGSYRSMASPPSVGSHPGSVMGWRDDSPSEESGGVGPYPFTMDPMQPPYMSPKGILNVPDMAMIPAPQSVENDSLSCFFNQHKDELKDALEVVAKDIQTSSREPKKQQVKVNSSLPLTGQVPESVISALKPAKEAVAPATTVSTSVTEAQSRPSKLPLPALPKAAASTAPPSVGPMPVVVVPTTIPPSQQPAVTMAPVLMVPGQSPQFIVVVNPNPKPLPVSKPKHYVPIRPKVPTPSPTPGTCGSPKASDKMPQTHAGCGTSDNNISNSNGTNSTNGLIPSSSQSSETRPASSRSPSSSRCAQQQRMLNIARRLVAGMTKNDLQFQDSEGDTYLHVSVCKADCNMVQALLERLTREQLHSMINMQNCMRQTPLYLAVSSNHPEMVRLLLQFGADVNIFAEHMLADGRSKEVKTALHCAASGGRQYLDTLKELLAAPDLQVDLVNSDGHTALHCAILEHHKPCTDGENFIDNLPIIHSLIKHGADPNAQVKKSGKTALMYALESRDIPLVEEIVALIDPVRLRTFLKTPAFDGSTCMRITENLQRVLDLESRQRLSACLRINSSRKESSSAS